MKIFNPILIFFGVLLLLLVTLALPPAILASGAQSVVFNREKVWRILEDSLLNDEAINAIRPAIIADTLDPSNDTIFSAAAAFMDIEALDAVWTTILPNTLIQELARPPFDDFYDWFAGDAEQLDITLTMMPLVHSVLDNKEQIIGELLGNLPACSIADALTYAQLFLAPSLDAEAALPHCQLPNNLTQQQINLFTSFITAEDFSEENTLIPLTESLDAEEVAEAKQGIRFVRGVSRFALWGVLGLWIFGIALSARDLKGLLRSFSIPALFGGTMTAGSAGILYWMSRELSQQLTQDMMADDMPAAVADALVSFLKIGVTQLTQPSMIVGLALAVAGLLALLAIPFVNNLQNTEEEIGFYQPAND